MAFPSLDHGAAFDAPAPPPWPIRRSVVPPFAAIAAAVGLEAAVVALPAPPSVARLLAPLLSGAVLSAIALGFAACSRLPVVERLRLRRGAFDARDVALLAVATTTASLVCALTVGASPFAPSAAAPASSATAIAPVVALAGLAALGEELLFRGYVQPRLEERWGRWAAIAVAAAASAAFPLDARRSALAFAFAVTLGWSASRARSTRPAVVAHVAARSITALCVALGAL